MNYRKLIGQTFAVILVLGIATGCSQPGSSPVRKTDSHIKNISISRSVSIVEKPFVQTPSQLWGGAIGGVVGSAIAAGSSNQAAYKLLLETNNIDLKAIVMASFSKKLAEPSSQWSITDKSGDAELQLSITFYGIHPSGPFSSKVEPQLVIEGKLVLPDGTVLKKAKEGIRFPSQDQVEPHTMEECAKDPQILLKGYTRLSEIIASILIAKLYA